MNRHRFASRPSSGRPSRSALAAPATLLLVVLAFVLAAPVRAQAEEKFVVVKAGRIIPVVGEPIEDGEIVIVNGKIRLVGRGLEYPANATIVDARDQTVMPGLVLARTRYGLRSYGRGGVHGDYTADDDFVPAEIDFENLVEAGFTTVGVYPSGVQVPGVATVYRASGSDGPTILLEPSYLRITMSNVARDKATFRNALRQAQGEIDKVEEARKEWEKKQKEKAEQEAKKKDAEGGEKNGEGKNGGDDEKGGDGGASGEKNGNEPKAADEPKEEAFEPPAMNPALVPLVHWIQGKLEVRPLVELGDASGLLHLEDVLATREEDLPHHVYLDGGGWQNDFVEVLEELAARDGVLLTAARLHRRPYTSTRLNLAGELARRGATIALLPASDGTRDVETYRIALADLVRAGLTRDAALEAATVNPARVLGVEERVGSIEKGKDADLLFLSGDPLDPLAEPTRVMILGETVWEAKE